MSSTEVLIIFYSRCGATERLAMEAAVGAVQAKATIRFRRLSDPIAVASDDSAECKENFARMQKEYVVPTEIDVLRADALILVAPESFDASSGEWTECFDLLTRLHSQGKLPAKVSAAIAKSKTARERLAAAILKIGFTPLPLPSDDATLQGSRVAAEARARKQSEGDPGTDTEF